jgi:hypothetical protein
MKDESRSGAFLSERGRGPSLRTPKYVLSKASVSIGVPLLGKMEGHSFPLREGKIFKSLSIHQLGNIT